MSKEPRPPPVNEGHEVANLIDRAKTGCNVAWRELDRHYGLQLLTAVRRLLPHGVPLRSLVDACDLVQETWLSVFKSLRHGQSFRTENHFVRYICKVAENHVWQKHRMHVTCEKRSLTREQKLDFRSWHTIAGAFAINEESDRDEEVGHFTRSLTKLQQNILVGLRQHSSTEVAAEFGLSERTVERIVVEVRRRWLERCDSLTS